MPRTIQAPSRSGMGLFFLVVAALSTVLLSSCYLTKQGLALIQQRSGAQSLDYLKSTNLKPETKLLIERVEKIRHFGDNEIGLHDTNNYRTLVELPKDYLVTVVSACQPLSFERYTWWFPLFGDAPYLGFFDDAEAISEADRLKKEGWETWTRHVDAFSTLGVLKDPLFSFMSRYSEYRLANLILHEQTHATIWSPGNFDFNEQLATFMGDQCALEYIGHEYGYESVEYRTVGQQDDDQRQFYIDLAELKAALQDVFTSTLSDAEKTKAKARKIGQWQSDFKDRYALRYRTQDYASVSSIAINNAFLDLYQTYTGRNGLFRRVYEHAGDSSRFIALMKEAATSGDPFAWMDKILAKP